MNSGAEQQARPPVQVTRAREGRMLAGVCAGLPRIWGLGTGWLRIGFVLAGLWGGLGVIVYLACWLVIPVADEDPDDDAVRGVVVVAWGVGALLAVVLVGALSAAATVFGLGWAVFAVAATVLVVVLSGRTRIPSLAALVTVAALTLPAAAVALTPIRLALQTGESVSRPADAARIDGSVYRSGLGHLLIDLRHTRLPSSGTITMRITAGLGWTYVALPTDQCVHVRVQYAIHPFATELATLFLGRDPNNYGTVIAFGRLYGDATASHPRGVAAISGGRSGPTLTIDFKSQGGGLYVRDYPNDLSPTAQPDWPGLPVGIEARPDVQGEPRRTQELDLRAWRRDRHQELRQARQIDRLLPGPCAR